MAPEARPIALDSEVMMAPDGSPFRVHRLDDPSLPADVLESKVLPWADLPPVGGTAMDPNGDLYFTDQAEDALRRRTPDGEISTIVQDPRLHWVDAPVIGPGRTIWMPMPSVPQNGSSRTVQRRTEPDPTAPFRWSGSV